MARDKLQKSFLFSKVKNMNSIKKHVKEFVIFLRPQLKKLKEIKACLKIAIKKILSQPRKLVYKSFQQINSILSG